MTKGNYLGEFELIVLLALVRLDEPAYGMSIYDEILDATGRAVSIQAVYVTLSRLERKGYVESRVGESTVERGGRARKYYTARPAGLSALSLSRAMFDNLWAGVQLNPRPNQS